ncbi:hypothetical protein NP493_5g10013 [Ridgeia piscesae]|uniref:Speriolin C-terminal domain-containing protein n=1 Tax=Ridgeia piscesae TaxID=27915 RepID=A0AAD9PFD4_RIDPI|nr:hypothetical protein NP493_5g10013 [Ridgeia piscesae]
MSQTRSPHMESVRMEDLEEDAQSNETLKSEIRHVLHENELLRAQLHLVRENAGLRIGSLLATIISWFEERDKPGNGSREENLRMYLRKHNLEIGGDATTYVSEQPMPAEPSRAEQAPWSAPPSGVISAELRDLESAPETHEATPLPGTSMSRPESSRPFSSVGRSETPRRGSGMGPKEAAESGSASSQKSGSYPQVQPTQPSRTRTSLPTRLDSSAGNDANDTDSRQRVNQKLSAVPEPRSSVPMPADRVEGSYDEMRTFHPEDRRGEQAPTTIDGTPIPLGKLKEASFHFTANSASTAPNPPYSAAIDYKANIKRSSGGHAASRQQDAQMYDARNYQDSATRNYQDPATRNYQDPATRNYQESAKRNCQDSASRNYQDPATRNYQDRATPTYQDPAVRSYQESAKRTSQEPSTRSNQEPASDGRAGRTNGSAKGRGSVTRSTEPRTGSAREGSQSPIIERRFGTRANRPPKMSVDTGFKRCLTAESANQMRRYEITRFNEGTPLVNEYGLLSTTSNLENLGYDSKSVFEELIRKVTPCDHLRDVLIFLDCLTLLAKEDGKPMITW